MFFDGRNDAAGSGRRVESDWLWSRGVGGENWGRSAERVKLGQEAFFLSNASVVALLRGGGGGINPYA